MIARSLLLFLLLIILPFLYFDLHSLRKKAAWWKRLLWWVPCAVMTGYTLYLAQEPNFIPDNDRILVLHLFLFILGLVIIPMWTYILCSLLGKGCSRMMRKLRSHSSRPPRNYGNLVGLVSVLAIWVVLFWGCFVGFSKLEVKHIKYASKDLPAAFDGYRVVLFSDAHVGTLTGSRQWILQRDIDSINAQQPDLIVFTGDLQNIHPQDLYPHRDLLSSLKAKDGVFSVLGNHDYAEYLGCDDVMKVANCRETVSLERQMGWTLLLNEHRTIERGNDHIIVAGMENDGDGERFPQKGDIAQTLDGVTDGDFILMLEHDPSSWRRKIIPDGRAQLTLSGHTHNMQFALFGISPLALVKKDVNGWSQEGEQSLFVTAGLSGLIPFRFGATGEIVVITMKSEK